MVTSMTIFYIPSNLMLVLVEVKENVLNTVVSSKQYRFVNFEFTPSLKDIEFMLPSVEIKSEKTTPWFL